MCVSAIVDCCPGYDPEKDADFLTYAYCNIGNAILNCRCVLPLAAVPHGRFWRRCLKSPQTATANRASFSLILKTKQQKSSDWRLGQNDFSLRESPVFSPLLPLIRFVGGYCNRSANHGLPVSLGAIQNKELRPLLCITDVNIRQRDHFFILAAVTPIGN